jgi:hypothetical protein
VKRLLVQKELNKVKNKLAFDEDTVLADALKYKTRTEWMNNSSKMYRFALAHGLAEKATTHMPYITEHGKWTKEKVIENAKKYLKQSEWRAKEPSAHTIAHRNGWMKEATAHMIKPKVKIST